MSLWSDFVERFDNEYPYTDYQKINLDWLLDGMKACIEAVGGFIQQYNPVTKTPAMTQPVGKDSSGKLWTAPGGGGGAVTSVNGRTGAVVLTASDVGAGTYSKPSGGIPKSDLASAVRSSLGKADTALQSAPVTSVNSRTGAVVLTASDVGAQAAPIVVTQSAPTAMSLADNTEYYLTDVGSLTLSYPGAAHWQCYITITTAASGTIAVTLPSSSYIGAAPSFANGETWELSIRDGVVVAGKAVA
jgi:hypothetical protein